MTPMLALISLNRPRRGNTKSFFSTLEPGYAESGTRLRENIGLVTKHLWVNVLIAIVLTVSAVFLLRTLGGEFIPKSNGDFISVHVELPSGTTLAETDEITLDIETVLKTPRSQRCLNKNWDQRRD